MVERLDAIIREAGPLGVVVLFFAAAAEYVFPPFPGDTITVAGGIYAVRGRLSLVLVYTALMAGSMCGALIDYALGRWLAGRLTSWEPHGWLARTFSLDQLQAWEARFRRRGSLYLAINRFLPGIRGPIFVAAGISSIPLSRVLIFGGISSALWNALLFGAGFVLGGNAERLETLITTYSRVVGLLVLLAIIALTFRYLWKRSKKPAESPRGSP